MRAKASPDEKGHQFAEDSAVLLRQLRTTWKERGFRHMNASIFPKGQQPIPTASIQDCPVFLVLEGDCKFQDLPCFHCSEGQNHH